MASGYPNVLDNFATNHVFGEVITHTTDNDQADALNKLELELGIQPSGSFATVKARFDALDVELGSNPSGTLATVKARFDALDTELGVDPSGTYADVKTRLDTTDNIVTFTRNQTTKGWVNHGSTAGTARPSNHATYEWYGSVIPTNAGDGDTYINTSTGIHYVRVAGSFIAQPQGSGGSGSSLRVASVTTPGSGATTLDLAGDKNVLFIVSVTGNFVASVTGLTAGARFIVETRENGTGGHALQYPGRPLAAPGPANVDWQSGVEFTPDNAANAIAFMEYYSPDGTNVRGLTGVATGGGGGGAQSYQDLGNISGAQTINMSGETNKLVIGRATAAASFTITNFALGAWLELRIQQPTGGTAAITWPTGLWPQGTGPITTLAANAVDRVAYNKSTSGTPDGFVVGNNFRTALP